MVTTNDASLAEKIRRLRDHGAAMTDLQSHLGARPYLLADHPDAGYNQRMTDLQELLALLKWIVQRNCFERQNLGQRYDEAFADLDWLRTPFKHRITSTDTRVIPAYSCQRIQSGSIEEINSKRNQWMDDLQKKVSQLVPQLMPFTCSVFTKRNMTL